MSKALIVSSFFPPLNSAGGSIRLVKLMKYLSLSQWQFVVYTRNIPGEGNANETLSHFLLDELPQDIDVERIAGPLSLGQARGARSKITGVLQRIFGDSSVGWGINVFRNAFARLKNSESDIDLIFSVTPPFTNALVCLLLSWAVNKPLVLDLKDDWVNSPAFTKKNPLRRRVEGLLESLIVDRAFAVITVTPHSFDVYNARYPQLRIAQKLHLIPNGCDLEEYDRLESRERQVISERFTILSAAWGYRKDYRDITPFLLALDVFFKRRIDAREKVEVILLGDSLSAEYDELLSNLRLEEVIHSMNAVRRNELVEQLWNADLFLLIQPVANTTAISGTLYEYWATGKAPVLLVSEKGASSALVEDNRLGRHFLFNQVEQIATYIEELFNAYMSEQPVWIERAGIENFDRRILAKRMNDIWRNALTVES